MDYLELDIKVSPKIPFSEIIIAQLSEIGFESFEETMEGVKAYIPENNYESDSLLENTILGNESENFTFSITKNKIPHQNWNAEWERNFEPVFVGEQLSILAPFHDTSLQKDLNVIIQPQMSFGTGHHQTTWMVSKIMLEMNEMPQNVLDMGSGTGILAILAEKLGAKDVLAVEIEPWSAINMEENGKRNNCANISYSCGDLDEIETKKFGLILANINKNILKKHIATYSKCLVNNGKIVLSGFFETDISDVLEFCKEVGLELISQETKETWAALLLKKI